MAKWLTRRGASVRVADTRAVPPRFDDLKRALPDVPADCGPFREDSFAGVDLVAISPGVPLEEPNVRRAVAAGKHVIGDIELFARAVVDRRPRIIAVTGTNGKSTVTALAGAMAKAAGADCEVAGNIGPAVLDALMRREDSGRAASLWVMELSSFQL
jgi:UDP-N-acetylmuramoylalanine--D-glutamate ligase